MDLKTASRLTPDDLGRWRWAMRDLELQNEKMVYLQVTKNTLHELINERYGLVEGDQFLPDGTIHRAPRKPSPNVTPLPAIEAAKEEAKQLQAEMDKAAGEAKG